HLKPFGCQVTILNTSDHLGKFKGKANEGFIVGYDAHSKAYRVYNLSNKKEHEAHSAAANYGFEFSNETAEMLHLAEVETCKNLVLAAGDPADSIVSFGGVPAGSVPAGSVPASSVPAGSILASSVPARSVPAHNVPTSNVSAGGVFAGGIDSAGFGDPAASESVPAVFTPDHAAV
nr:retrovirus-related Pol polyprotein from transposon TNT 1-94 [Tanacetum cinerariifolium]